jgi:hypothetical protein
MQADLEPDVRLEEAATWLSVQNPPPRPVVPTLRKLFGLSPSEACRACTIADQITRQHA